MAQPSNKHKKDSADESRPLLQEGENQPSSTFSQDREYYTSPSSSPRPGDRSGNAKYAANDVVVEVTTDVRTATRSGSFSSTGSGSSTDTESEADEQESNNVVLPSSSSLLHPSTANQNNTHEPNSSSTSTTFTSDQEQARPPHRRRHHHRHRNRRPRTPYQIMLSIFAQSGLLIFFGTLAFVIVKAPWVSPFSWHPICMGLYGFVSTQAVLLLQPNLTGQRKEGGKTLHFALLTVAFLTSIFGFQAIWNNKELLGKPHFHTNHAYLGGLTLVIFLCQVLYGLLVGYAPATIYGRIGKARATRIHRVAGYCSISMVWGTLWLGVLTSWMEKNFDGYQWIFALSMGMVAVGTVGQITPRRLWLRNGSSDKRDERELSSSAVDATTSES